MDSTNRPKPHPPIKKTVEEKTSPINSPFSDEALFEKLRQQASENSIGPKNPRRVKKSDEERVEKKPAEKKPFVFKEHLTERPFKNHDGLQKLKESITTEEPRPRYLGE